MLRPGRFLPVGLLLLLATTASAQRRPDIVLFLLDDADARLFDDNPGFRRFGERGMRFTAHVPSPQCAPSRASILTGLHAHNHGVVGNVGGDLAWQANARGNMLADWLQQAGYRTVKAGKWINGVGSYTEGWDVWIEVAREEPSGPWLYELTQQAMSAIYGTPDEQPLFLYFAPGHDWMSPSDAYAGTYRGFPGSVAWNELDISDKRAWRRPLLTVAEMSEVIVRWQRRHEVMHDLRDALSAIEQAFSLAGRPAPIFLVTSDHGYMQGEHRIPSGKGVLYREATEVPLFLVGPDVPQGSTAALVYPLDVTATIADLAGAATPELDGRSLLPLVEDPDRPWRRRVLLEHGGGAGARAWVGVRTRSRKVALFGAGWRELYAVAADPFEMEQRCEAGDRRCGHRLLKMVPALATCRGQRCWQDETDRVGEVVRRARAIPATSSLTGRERPPRLSLEPPPGA
ncbi:MAG: sulfatase-like hydrolase/transferase [Thermodesulfobacteriota bacterium]